MIIFTERFSELLKGWVKVLRINTLQDVIMRTQDMEHAISSKSTIETQMSSPKECNRGRNSATAAKNRAGQDIDAWSREILTTYRYFLMMSTMERMRHLSQIKDIIVGRSHHGLSS